MIMNHGGTETRREPIPAELNAIADDIVDSALKVHSALGPGLLESVYEICLAHELTKRGYKVRRQVEVPVIYDGIRFDTGFRLDLLVDDLVIIEIKAVEDEHPVHEAQLLSHMRLLGKRLGFLINFNVALIKQGIKRRAL
jgi:GxxExxY protein